MELELKELGAIAPQDELVASAIRRRGPPGWPYHASRDRRQEYPTRHLQSFSCILQADAYNGYHELRRRTHRDRSRLQSVGPTLGAPVLRAGRRRRQCEAQQDAVAISPIALEAFKRIDALLDIERGINGQSAEQRLRLR
nr:transposase [Bradyrhizobium sp. CCBAU 11434]